MNREDKGGFLLGDQKMFAKNTPRYFIAWFLIIGIILSITIAVVYNINAVMVLFGRGNIQTVSYDYMRQIVYSSPDTYTVASEQLQSPNQEILQYELSEGAVQFRITGDPTGKISEIRGTIQVSELNFSPLDLYATMNDAVKPLCHQKDILAAEVAIFKYVQKAQLTSYTSHVMFSSVYDNKLITIQKQKNSFEINFDILMQ